MAKRTDHSVLSRREFRDTAHDTAIVENNSGKAIKYLLIDTNEIILFFETAAGIEELDTEFPITRRFEGLLVESEFADGTSIGEFSDDFDLKGRREPRTFKVDLRADKTIVEMVN